MLVQQADSVELWEPASEVAEPDGLPSSGRAAAEPCDSAAALADSVAVEKACSVAVVAAWAWPVAAVVEQRVYPAAAAVAPVSFAAVAVVPTFLVAVVRWAGFVVAGLDASVRERAVLVAVAEVLVGFDFELLAQFDSEPVHSAEVRSVEAAALALPERDEPQRWVRLACLVVSALPPRAPLDGLY